ncbi:MAG: Pectate lyase superfamily protein [Candidatus Methanofastidiosum methylothiophilum]|uniref:Pectate lyase superfamily protein n=1 Tax=Candidatus Methanofastidiosum methylothiophilum TaxID=1705564 RepID=A0A150IWH5_9EURY|nr:MAG: Pectate lyase superfamily protein [Candidatus Methanofastidiosum methylthiophilus]NMC77540.1 hypothetical protein [Candidatus Methanofastidiosa archaeon]
MKKIRVFLIFILLICSSSIFTKEISCTTITVTPGQSIQNAINSASPGDVIFLSSGIFTENFTINKRVSIVGSGDSTILRRSTNNPVIRVTSSGVSGAPILLKSLRIEPEGRYGIEIPNGQSVSYLSLENVKVVGGNLSYTENEIGFKVATDASLFYLSIMNCSFEYCDMGWYFAKHGDWLGGSIVQYVTVENTSISNNDYKGIYVEKLSDATFKNCKVYNNGIKDNWNQSWNGGFDINLKGMAYQNLVFENLDVTGNGLGYKEGAGIMIKARDDGPTYGAYPASLSNVQIIGGIFRNNERGIRFGEPNQNNLGPTGVLIKDSKIFDNMKKYNGNDGSIYGGVVNHTRAIVDARYNWWGHISGPYHPSLNPWASGNAVSDRVEFRPWYVKLNETTLPVEGIIKIINVGRAKRSVGEIIQETNSSKL